MDKIKRIWREKFFNYYVIKRKQIIEFADDTVIMTRSNEKFEIKNAHLEVTAHEVGLKINKNKTKYIKWTDTEEVL